MSELKPCPFCGGEAEVQHQSRKLYGDVVDWYGVYCKKPFCGFVSGQSTEAEAIAAWNTRAAMEFDNWFYLPKPREPIVEVTETTHAWDGTKVKTDVYYQIQEQAIVAWARELDEHITKRICEVWNPERTCKFVDDSDDEPSPPKCSVCGYDPGIYECAWYEDGTYGYERNYCPNCGAKVIA